MNEVKSLFRYFPSNPVDDVRIHKHSLHPLQVMEVCQDVLHGLSLLNKHPPASRITDQEFTDILSIVGKSLRGEQDVSVVRTAETKLAILSLVVVLSEAARQHEGVDGEAKVIADTLRDADVDDSRVTQVITLYREERDALVARLEDLKISCDEPPLVTDINWKQEVVVKTSSLNKMPPLLNYRVKLETIDDRDIQFTTDISGLQHLVNGLREACKAVDNLEKG